MIAIDYDSGDIARKLGILARKIGVTVQLVAYDQMRLWVNDMIRRTPPKTKGQGKKAIKTDLNLLFVEVRNDSFREFLEHRVVNRKFVSPALQFNLDGNKGRMKRWHQRHRATGGSKAGRVRYKGVVIGQFMGVDFVNKMYVSREAFNAYLAKVQEGVGKLKAGWIPAAQFYAKKSNGPWRAPPWVMAQSKQMGDFTDLMRPSGSGFIEARNFAPGADNNRSIQRWAAFTGRTRDRDISKNAEKRLDKIIDQFNKAA